MVGLMKGVKPRTVLARPSGWIVVPGTRRRYQRLLSGASGLGPHSQKRAESGMGCCFPNGYARIRPALGPALADSSAMARAYGVNWNPW